SDRSERPERVLPVHIAMTSRDEVPPSPRIAPGQMRPEDSASAGRGPQPGVLAIDVIDAICEVRDEADCVDSLPQQMAGVPVETERFAMVDRLQRPCGGPIVVRDLRGMNLVRESDPFTVEDIENRVPSLREVLIPLVDDRRRYRREHRD